MKFIKKNKGVIIFYLLVLASSLILSYNNTRIDNNSLVYVEK